MFPMPFSGGQLNDYRIIHIYIGQPRLRYLFKVVQT